MAAPDDSKAARKSFSSLDIRSLPKGVSIRLAAGLLIPFSQNSANWSTEEPGPAPAWPVEKRQICLFYRYDEAF
jgi:hypothetical protein